MATNNEYSALIEKYFDRHMSGSEQAAFEDQLSSDPMLKSEFEHQGEIIEGLKEFRKLQLKTRLDNIPVTPGLIGTISQSGTIKTVSYIAASVIVGTGLYFGLSDDDSNNYYLESLEPKLEYVSTTSDLNDFDGSLDFRYEHKELVIQSEVEAPDVVRSETPPESPVENTKNAVSFNIPDMSAGSEDEAPLQTEELLRDAPKKLDELSGDITPVKIEIENIITDQYSFHYKLENGKLYLYGDFNVSPYKIIEVNSKTGKKLFFHYNGNYFRLNKQRQITPLEEIIDQSLIDELNIIKSK